MFEKPSSLCSYSLSDPQRLRAIIAFENTNINKDSVFQLAPPLTEKLLTVEGFWERDTQLSSRVASYKGLHDP